MTITDFETTDMDTTVDDAESSVRAGAGASPVVLSGSMARHTRVRPVLDYDVDLIAYFDDACLVAQTKTTTVPTSPAGQGTLEDLRMLFDQVYHYAASRMADEQTATRLTSHVLESTVRSLLRAHHADGDLPTRTIKLAMRTANSWEDAARRAHATAPPIPALRKTCCRVPASASARYPDPAASRAVVVGAASTPTAPYLHEVDASAAAVAERLGGAAAQPAVLRGEQATSGQVLDATDKAARESTDLLLVYYAGHGALSEGDRLQIGTADSTLAFTDLYERTRRSPAAHVVFILDACAADAASQELGRLGVAPTGRDEYVISAAGRHDAALARIPGAGHGYTAFTGALLDALTRGVPEGGDALDIATLYSAVDQSLARGTLPRPHLYASGKAPECWALAPNPGRRTARHRPRRRTARKPDDEQLLADTAHGDQYAWNELVNRYSRLVWSTARSFRLDDEECGKVFHDAWQLVLCDLDKVDAANLPRLVTQTARWRALDALRERAYTVAPGKCPQCASSMRTRRTPGLA